jgi:MoaA/NifB/PqqE/SkfB family radical SAM enzyme
MKEELPYLGVRYQIKYHKCNLTCPYCIANWQESENMFDNARYQSIIRHLSGLPYRICLRIGVGGEPFTSIEFLEGVKQICNTANSIFGVSFSTNLEASWERTIEPFLDSLDTTKLGIGCTLHDTVISDIDGFFEKARRIKEMGVEVFIGLVALPDRINLIREYYNRCHDLDIPLIMNGLIGKLVSDDGKPGILDYPQAYSSAELADFKKLWHSPHSYKMLLEACDTKGMHCSAGKNYIYLNHQGDVFPCSNIKEKLGNILTDPFILHPEDTICPVSTCWCGNENQALRIVDKYYDRSRSLRIIRKRAGIPADEFYEGYNKSIFS